METQRHVSLQIFLQHLFLLLSTMFTRPGNSFYSGGHCIQMSHESLLESSCSNVQLISTVHSAVLRHMLLGIFVQPCSLVSSEPWHQSSSCPYLFHFQPYELLIRFVMRKTFSSFDLFLSSESYSLRVNPIMHQANLSCNSVLT